MDKTHLAPVSHQACLTASVGSLSGWLSSLPPQVDDESTTPSRPRHAGPKKAALHPGRCGPSFLPLPLPLPLPSSFLPPDPGPESKFEPRWLDSPPIANVPSAALGGGAGWRVRIAIDIDTCEGYSNRWEGAPAGRRKGRRKRQDLPCITRVHFPFILRDDG